MTTVRMTTIAVNRIVSSLEGQVTLPSSDFTSFKKIRGFTPCFVAMIKQLILSTKEDIYKFGASRRLIIWIWRLISCLLGTWIWTRLWLSSCPSVWRGCLCLRGRLLRWRHLIAISFSKHKHDEDYS